MKLSGRKKVCFWILVAALVFYTIKSIFVGADIDESYGVTLGYRLVQGDLLLWDMWEPHQTSGIFTALFIRLILLFTGGSLHYMTVFLRICFFLVQAGIALYLYYSLKDCIPVLDRPERILFAMLCYLTTPKCNYVPEYSNLHMWFSTLLILFLLQYFCKDSRNFGRGLYLVLAGGMLACDVLAYPSMVLFYPFCAGVILFFSDTDKKRRNWRGLLQFTLPCVLGAAVFLGYIGSYMSMDDIALVVPAILGDGSHQMSMAEKTGIWLSDGFMILLVILGCAAVAAVLILPIKKIYGRKADFSNTQKWNGTVFLLCAWFVTQMVYQIICWLNSDYNSGYPQIVYAAVPLLGLWCVRKCRKKEQIGLLMIWFSIVNYIALNLFSNWRPLCLNVYLVIGLLGGMLCWRQYFWEKCGEFGVQLVKCLCVIFILIEVFGRCLLVIGGDEGSNMLFQVRGISRQGVRGGILTSYMNSYRYNDNYNRFSELIPEGSKVLYLGPSSFYYMLGDCQVAAPSTISTPEYDESLQLYYELHPERFPDVVVMESCYGDVSYFASDDYIFQWIEKEFAPDIVEDYPYVRVYYKSAP